MHIVRSFNSEATINITFVQLLWSYVELCEEDLKVDEVFLITI